MAAKSRRRFRDPRALYRFLEPELHKVELGLRQGMNYVGRVSHPTFAKLLNSV
ncbi:hypothetical protein MMPV_007060 [Pyropia vietnamensis]